MSPPTPQERDMVFYTYIKDKNCIEMSQSLCRMMLQDITLKVENLVVGCRTCYAGPFYRMAQYLLIRLCYKKSHITCRNHHEMSHILRRIVYKMSHIYCVNFKCTGAHTIQNYAFKIITTDFTRLKVVAHLRVEKEGNENRREEQA